MIFINLEQFGVYDDNNHEQHVCRNHFNLGIGHFDTDMKTRSLLLSILSSTLTLIKLRYRFKSSLDYKNTESEKLTR